MEALLAQNPFDVTTYVITAVTVLGAYVIFGISSFGAALFVVPLMSHFFPPAFVLPACVLLDVTASLTMGVRFSAGSDKRELAWLVPTSLAGAVMGVTLLVNLPRATLNGALGVFLVLYGAYRLVQSGPGRQVSRIWAPVAGFTGGAFGTLIGIGAPPYAIYLSRRMRTPMALRATLSNMVLFSTGMRALVFAVGGLMLADRLIAYVLLVPWVFVGIWLGNRIHGRLSHDRVLGFVSTLLVLIGVSLVWRVLAIR